MDLREVLRQRAALDAVATAAARPTSREAVERAIAAEAGPSGRCRRFVDLAAFHILRPEEFAAWATDVESPAEVAAFATARCAQRCGTDEAVETYLWWIDAVLKRGGNDARRDAMAIARTAVWQEGGRKECCLKLIGKLIDVAELQDNMSDDRIDGVIRGVWDDALRIPETAEVAWKPYSEWEVSDRHRSENQRIVEKARRGGRRPAEHPVGELRKLLRTVIDSEHNRSSHALQALRHAINVTAAQRLPKLDIVESMVRAILSSWICDSSDIAATVFAVETCAFSLLDIGAMYSRHTSIAKDLRASAVTQMERAVLEWLLPHYFPNDCQRAHSDAAQVEACRARLLMHTRSDMWEESILKTILHFEATEQFIEAAAALFTLLTRGKDSFSKYVSFWRPKILQWVRLGGENFFAGHCLVRQMEAMADTPSGSMEMQSHLWRATQRVKRSRNDIGSPTSSKTLC